MIRALTAGFLGALLVACGNDPLAPGADAGSAAVVACDPHVQDCPAGQACDLGCRDVMTTAMCRPQASGGVVAGGKCGGLAEVCATGLTCLAGAMGGPFCVRFCRGDSDCDGRACREVGVTRQCGPGTVPIMVRVCS